MMYINPTRTHKHTHTYVYTFVPVPAAKYYPEFSVPQGVRSSWPLSLTKIWPTGVVLSFVVVIVPPSIYRHYLAPVVETACALIDDSQQQHGIS